MRNSTLERFPVEILVNIGRRLVPIDWVNYIRVARKFKHASDCYALHCPKFLEKCKTPYERLAKAIKHRKDEWVCEFSEQVLAEGGQNLNTALLLASENGHMDLVKSFAKHVADVWRNHALIHALWGSHMDIAGFLVENGAKIDCQQNESLFLSAIRKGHFKVVKYLVDNGADVNAQEGSPLYFATKYGRLDIIKYLVEAGRANVYSNNHCFLLAIKCGRLDIVKCLVENGADVNCKSGKPLSTARQAGNLGIVAYLADKGAV